MTDASILKTFGDAYVLASSREFDELTLTLKLWDESTATIHAASVGRHEDIGTWEIEAIVRVPEHDLEEHFGFAVVDTDDVRTLTFLARSVTYKGNAGDEQLWPAPDDAQPMSSRR